MKTPPLSSCQYTSQMLKARNPSAIKNRHGRRRMSLISCRMRSSSAIFSSGVMGRKRFMQLATNQKSLSESSLPK